MTRVEREAILRLVREAPPMSDAQKARVSSLLRKGPNGAHFRSGPIPGEAATASTRHSGKETRHA